MKKVIIFFIIINNLIFSVQEIRVRPKQSQDDASHSYFVEVLQLALNNTEKEYGKALVKVVTVEMTQGRALEELQKGNYIDVDWAGTNLEREEKLRPIRIPLIGGLLGYRVPVIRKENVSKFTKIKGLSDLMKYTAVAGLHWPDSVIMEKAGLKVYKVAKFEQMYPMLESGRVDYFPRGINEVYAEVKSRSNDDLVAFDKIILAYKFPMYFFTSKKKSSLAKRVEKGLMIAVNNGTLLKLIKNHPATSQIFPLEKYKNSLIIEINNPYLSKETPLDNKKLWIDIK